MYRAVVLVYSSSFSVLFPCRAAVGTSSPATLDASYKCIARLAMKFCTLANSLNSNVVEVVHVFAWFGVKPFCFATIA